MEIIEIITLEEVRNSKPKNIYYAAHTCWWTHDPEHLSVLPSGLPCDPRGSVLFMTDNINGFLDAAIAKSEHYGKHGIRAFMAAHHLNCVNSIIFKQPYSERNWQFYNDALDRLDEYERIRKSYTESE